MPPRSLAFYLDVISTGTVLGARPTDSPERVTGILGPDYAENSAGDGSMWRDYGMVEFSWQRDGAGRPWAGHHFTLQVHRLARSGGGGKDVNEVIRARYGRFARHVRFSTLRQRLEKRGAALLEIPGYAGNAPYYRTYWQPDSLVSVTVIAARGEYSTPERARIGDVYTIGSPVTAEEVASQQVRSR
ncbi:hypothetical protein ACH4FX_20280 [Streptomyces sp. NPDC018019]|uniref:hypothetical protein n=1 Tax=Streptomyces sp. NPDC018019 TaxID=3365030 RepID=UPI0037BAA1A0